MKYARLSLEQLESLHEEFAQYLATQQVTADEWKAIKVDKPEMMNEMLDVFSDIVWDNVLSKVDYLEFVTEKDLKIFACHESKLEVIGVKVADDLDIDLTSEKGFQSLFEQLEDERIEIYTGEKAYDMERKEELFDMISKGCYMANAELWDTFKEIIA